GHCERQAQANEHAHASPLLWGQIECLSLRSAPTASTSSRGVSSRSRYASGTLASTAHASTAVRPDSTRKAGGEQTSIRFVHRDLSQYRAWPLQAGSGEEPSSGVPPVAVIR